MSLEKMKETKDEAAYMKSLFEKIPRSEQQRVLGYLEGLLAQEKQAS